MQMTADEFLKEAGLKESLAPGEVKYIRRPAEKEGNSYTVVYDWNTHDHKIVVEVRPGLTGQWPDKKELGRYAVWLQTKNSIEFEISNNMAEA